MTKSEEKRHAQDEILSAVCDLFCDASPKERAALDVQLRRLEKMYGYVSGSWVR